MTGMVLLVVVALVGLVLWMAPAGKASEVGRALFFCAMLALCFGASPSSSRWFR